MVQPVEFVSCAIALLDTGHPDCIAKAIEVLTDLESILLTGAIIDSQKLVMEAT